MERRRDRKKVEGWRNGRMERWEDGEMEGWRRAEGEADSTRTG